MNLPAPKTVTRAELVADLRRIANIIIRIDGDRDNMNPSDLNCEQSIAAAKLLVIAADELEMY